jgi:hypothetical protein
MLDAKNHRMDYYSLHHEFPQRLRKTSQRSIKYSEVIFFIFLEFRYSVGIEIIFLASILLQYRIRLITSYQLGSPLNEWHVSISFFQAKIY